MWQAILLFISIVVSINIITAIKARIERAEIQETISESITELEQLRTEILNLGSESVANEISNLIANFESVRDNAVPTVLNAVVSITAMQDYVAIIIIIANHKLLCQNKIMNLCRMILPILWKS